VRRLKNIVDTSEMVRDYFVDGVCVVGSCSVSGASSDQSGAEDATGERLRGAVHSVLHAQGSDAASGTAQSVRRRTLQGRQTHLKTQQNIFSPNLAQTHVGLMHSTTGVCVCCLASGGTNLYGVMMYGG